jgi:hypothetical protein
MDRCRSRHPIRLRSYTFGMADSLDEDREIRESLSVLPLDARVQHEGVWEWPTEKRDELLLATRRAARPRSPCNAYLYGRYEQRGAAQLLRALRDLDSMSATASPRREGPSSGSRLGLLPGVAIPSAGS